MNRPIYKRRASHSIVSLLWYLLYLSIKYDLNIGWLYKGLVDASTSQRSTCGTLMIEYRGKSEESLVFFLTDGSAEFVRQLRIPQKLLEGEALLKILGSQGPSRFNMRKPGKFRTIYDFLDIASR